MLTRRNLRLYDALDIVSSTPEELDLSPADFDDLRSIAQWADTYLCNPHADLGRPGPVCPFAKSSIDHRLFLLGLLHLSVDETDEIDRAIGLYRDWFTELDGALMSQGRYATFVLLLPDVDRNNPTPLDEIQKRLKDSFVEISLMVGQFHPRCAQPGLWNPHFEVLQSPVPLLAIRNMVASDLPFLISERAHLESYLRVYAPELPAHTRQFLIRQIMDGSQHACRDDAVIR
jgi:hypothetical protein